MSKSYKTGFVITGDASGGVNAIKMTREEMDHLNRTQQKTRSEFQATNSAQQQVADTARLVEQQFGSLDQRISNTANLVKGLAAAWLSFSAGKMADSWSDLTSRVGQAAGATVDVSGVMDRLGGIARTTYSSLELTAESFLRNSTILKSLGKTTQEQLDYTEALNNALVVSGAKGHRAQMVQEALSRSMADGAMNGQGLALVMNYGSRAAELLADELGVDVVQLRQLAAEGKITGSVIYSALTKNMETLRNEAESMPATLGDGLMLIRNAMLQSVGVMDQAGGLSESVAERMVRVADSIRDIDWESYAAGVAFVASNLDVLATVAGGVAVVALGRYAGAQAASTAAALQGVAAKQAAAAQELRLAQANYAAATAAVANARAQVGLTASHGQAAAAATAQAAAAQRLAAAQTAAGASSRLLMGALGVFGGPAGLAATAGIAGIVLTMQHLNRQAQATRDLLNELTIKHAEYQSGRNTESGLLAQIEAENQAIARLRQSMEQAEKTRDQLQDQLKSGVITGSAVAGVAETIRRLQDAIAAAPDQIQARQRVIDELSERLRGLGVDYAAAGQQTLEQRDAVEKLTDSLLQQYHQLVLGERGYLEYQLAQQAATVAQSEQTLAAFDSVQAIKAQQAAQQAHAKGLNESLKSNIATLADVEVQSARVWAELAAGRITAEQAAAAIDLVAAAGQKSVEEQDKWVSSVLDAIDPTRALAREMERVWAAFDAGALDAGQVAAYVDHLTKGFQDSADSGEQAFEAMANRVAQTLQQAIASGDWSGVGQAVGGVLAGEIGGLVSKSLAANLGSSLGTTAGTLLGGIGGALVGGVIGGMFAGRKRSITEELQLELSGLLASGFELTTIKTSGMLGSSTRRYQQAVSDATLGIIERSFGMSAASIEQQARYLGLDAAAALDDFSFKLRDSGLTLDQFTAEAAQSYVQTVFAAITDYQYAHESIMDAWTRMSADARNIGSAFERGNAGQSFQQAYGSILDQSRAAIVAEQTAVRDAVLAEMAELDRLRDGARYVHGGRNQQDRWTDEYAALMQIYASELGMSGVRVGQGSAGLSGAAQRRAGGQVDQRLAAELADANARIQQAYETATASFVNGITHALAMIEGVDIESAGALFAQISDNWLVATQGQEALLLAYQQQTEQAVNDLFARMGLAAEYGAGDVLASYDALFDDYRAAAVASAQAAGTDLASALGRAEGEIARMRQALLDADAAAQEYAGSIGSIAEAYLKGGESLVGYFSELSAWAAQESVAIEQDYRNRIRLLEEQGRLGKQLGDYVAQLRVSELSTADPGQRLAAAGDQFAALLVQAQAGDLESARQLQQAAEQYLKNADAYYGRTDVYASIFDDVAAQLEQLGLDLVGASGEDRVAALNEQMLAEQQQVREYLGQELEWAAAQYDKLGSIEQLLGVLPASLGSALRDLLQVPGPAAGGQPVRPDIPAFAGGGYHAGGVRLVGERGPELEITGPSRIMSADQTRNLLAGPPVDLGPVVRELQQLRADNLALRQQVSGLQAVVQVGAGEAARQRQGQMDRLDAIGRNTREPVRVP